ncbi:MAG TPA: glycosyltransferase [Bacteroidales bacterium]|nr:glycosyltransferase [Bacteroidales bacterium]
MRMKICHITTVHTPFDGRIFHKECKSLATAGYEVFLVAPHDRNEEVDGVNVRGIKKITNPYKRLLVAPFMAFRAALKTKSRIFHLHDPELLLPGFFISLTGRKVIFDSHEYVGQQILSKHWIPTRLLRFLISVLYNLLEQSLTIFFAGIIVAEEDTKKQFRLKKRVKIIHNYPILHVINQQKFEEISRNSDRIVIYVGGLTRIRGIKELVIAMRKIDARLWLLGPWESDHFRRECESIDAWDKCDYMGVIPFGKQYDYLRAADIGMATLYPEKNYLRSLPVKAFEYMACKLPIVMSDFDYWQDFFGEYALFVNPRDPEDIASKANHLLKNESLMRKMSEEGFEKVNREYSWEEESRKLIGFYNEIVPAGN